MTVKLYPGLKDDSYAEGDLRVLPLREEDIFEIMEWRNAQRRVLRQKKVLDRPGQQAYFDGVVRPSFLLERPGLMLFSYLSANRLIGYGGLTNIDWDHRRAELSFLVAPSVAQEMQEYARVFAGFIRLMKRIVFDELQLNRLFTETYAFRDHHMHILESEGFVREGRLREHVVVDGEPCDSVIHAILRNDPKS